MKGDFTRDTFEPKKHYSSVRMQQGRVQLDADWNEQIDIQTYLDEVTRRDVIGRCGGPQGKDAGGNPLAGFAITAHDGGLHISRGRYYVHGILCENEVPVMVDEQEDLPSLPPAPALADLAAEVAPPEPGIYLAYLDVWRRHITALEDRDIREVALGGPDTATRAKTVWQVKLFRVGNLREEASCSRFGLGWAPPGTTSTGRLAAQAAPDEGSDKPCVVPAKAGYRRLENQLYRVEIHTEGEVGEATFKWSRENGSIVTRWEGKDGNNLTVGSAGRDQVLCFVADGWVELTDDTRELWGLPGTLVRLTNVEGNVLTIDPTSATGPVNLAAFPNNPKVRRWESNGDAGALAVEIPTENDGWIELEDGVQVKFRADGTYRSGDYWLIPARTVLGDVLWPIKAGGPKFDLRHGTAHHYCPLAICAFSGNRWEVLSDCRKLFPPLTELPAGGKCCCTVTVGDGVHSQGDFDDIQAAVDSLEQGGQVCILPGKYLLQEPVTIRRKRGVTISGCRQQTRIVSTSDKPAFAIAEGRAIRLESLTIAASSPAAAVVLKDTQEIAVTGCLIGNRPQREEGLEETPRERPIMEEGVEEIPLGQPAAEVENATIVESASAIDASFYKKAKSTAERLLAERVLYREEEEYVVPLEQRPSSPGAALLATRCAEVTITDNLFLGLPAIALQVRDASITGNRLEGGGVWMWDGSSLVRIQDNQISGGDGAGIGLGGLPGDKAPSGYASGVRGVQILGNLIGRMANSGITTLLAKGDKKLDLGELEDVTIAHNRIVECAREGPNPAFDPDVVGGIVLRNAAGVRIHDNVIARNGARSGVPACGIATHTCLGLEISDNKIEDNGGEAKGQLACIDFSKMPESTAFNPHVEQGVTFTQRDAQGNKVSEISILSGGRGLWCGEAMHIQFPTPVSQVELILIIAARLVEITALAGDSTVASVQDTSQQHQPQSIKLTGHGIDQVVITCSQDSPVTLQRICFGQEVQGLQAGIAAAYVMGGLPLRTSRGTERAKARRTFQGFDFAARIHDNVVICPYGRALDMVGLGAMSIADNTLISKGRPRSEQTTPREKPSAKARQASARAMQLGSCVSIRNLGGMLSLLAEGAGHSAVVGLHMHMEKAPESRDNVGNRPNMAIVNTPSATAFPDGRVLFHGNQVSLQDVEPAGDQSAPPVITIASKDDVSMQDNQVHVIFTAGMMRFATLAAAPMVRASQNRFMENYGAAIVSCWTRAQIQNQTTGNQATHCLLATGPQLIEQGNQILYPSVCEFLQKVGSGKEKYVEPVDHQDLYKAKENSGEETPVEPIDPQAPPNAEENSGGGKYTGSLDLPDFIDAKGQKISIKALLDSFDRTAKQLLDDQAAEMHRLADLLGARAERLIRVEERLAANMGDDHPQVVTMRLTATASGQIRDALDTTAIRQARLPYVKAHEWMVHGQVVDEAGEPLEGLRVRVYDKDRKYDDLLGDTETDEYGDFAVVYHERDFFEVGEALPELYIMVEDQQGNKLYSSQDSVRAKAGRIERFEIILQRRAS